MNTGIVCMSPNFQWDATICQYWKQTDQILPGHSHCLLLLRNSYVTDWRNHLNNGRSLLLQTFLFWLALLDHLRKLWCSCYRHYTWKMDLPLTFFWFSSISCEPSGYSYGRTLSYCQDLCNKYCTAIYRIWLEWRIVFAAYKFCFIDADTALLPQCYLSRLGASFSSPLMSLSLTPDHLCKTIPRGKQLWILLIRLSNNYEE